jgi:hypothetical protein
MAHTNGQVLAGLRQRFDEWRRLRRHPRSRIPESLWGAAVEAAREHGLWKTARQLRVDYYSLKRRLASNPPPAAGIDFVEVSPKILSPRPACVLTLEDGRGRRLRVELSAGAGAEALARTLWRSRR